MIEHEASSKNAIDSINIISQLNRALLVREFENEDSFLRLNLVTSSSLRDERLQILSHDLAVQANEFQSYVAILQCQFSVLCNLINQRDNFLGLVLAESSKDIATATRNDGPSMKTIAIVTLVYLPGTFVSAIFSTTLFDFRNSCKWWWLSH
jgi:hypothetical protein